MRNFLKKKDGNVAMTFAIAMLPIIMAGGTAIDYTGLYRARSDIQVKLDAATLAAGKKLPVLGDDEVRELVRDFLAANLTEEEFSGLKNVDIRIDRENFMVETAVTGTYPTSFMRIAGIDSLEYTPRSEVSTSSNGELEVVLVLDNTYSMSVDGKMAALKDSAEQFVDTFLDHDGGLRGIKLGIVPFSNYVNVGLDNRNANWMEVEKDSEEEICYQRKDIISKSGCTTKTGYNDGVPYTYESCTKYTYGKPYNYCYTSRTEWLGCAGSRAYPLNLADEKYNKRVPGAMNQYCPRRLTQLTSSVSKVKSEIDAMFPSGETYIPTGLVWGWRVISEIKPFSEGVNAQKAKKSNVRKAVILMTDGENQVSISKPDSSTHWGRDVEEADNWTLEVCDNIKSDDILVFTIGFGDIPEKALNVLQSCATDPDHYVHAKDADALVEAFSNFSAQLSNLYLSK